MAEEDDHVFKTIEDEECAAEDREEFYFDIELSSKQQKDGNQSAIEGKQHSAYRTGLSIVFSDPCINGKKQ